MPPANDETQAPYPFLPDVDDPNWLQANIRARSRRFTELRNLPHEQASKVMMHVYSGDAISVMREVRYYQWIAVKVGYHVGWVNTAHVGFTLLPMARGQRELLREKMRAQQQQTIDPDETVGAEEVSSNLRKQIADVGAQMNDKKTAHLTSNEVNRIIRYLKGIANTLRGAQSRGDAER